MRQMQALGGLVVLALAGGAHATAPSGANSYTVKSGDTLARVAARTGVPVAALAEANGIANRNLVRIGQVLTIPAEGGPAKEATGTYRVQKGDTLARVAKRTGVAVDALAKANDITNPHKVRAGQVLTIPTVGEPAPAVAAPLPPLPSPVVVVGGGREHRVAGGQTLAVIARTYETTIAELVKVNELANPNLIREGAVLRVPGGEWLCPVQGPHQFGEGWGQPRAGGRRHLGVDVFAAKGTPVVASVGGALTHSTGSLAGNAYYLKGDDGNTYYGAHLDTVAPPGRVERGAVVGTVGSTGNAKGTTPHLHFEIKPGGGASVDPFPTLDAWC